MASKQEIIQAISQVLDQMGVGGDGGDVFDEGGMTSANEVPVWAKLNVNVADEGRGPIHDKGALFGGKQYTKPPEVGNYVDTYGMPYDDQAAEMMTAMGMV